MSNKQVYSIFSQMKKRSIIHTSALPCCGELNSTHITKIFKLVFKHQCRLKSGASQPKNEFCDQRIQQHVRNKTLNRVSFATERLRTAVRVKGSTAFVKQRSLILKSKSVHEIDRILHSQTDFDSSVYSVAIKRAGRLRDINYCMKIERMVEKRNVTRDSVFYTTLFEAFNLNRRPFLCDKYLEQMVGIYRVVPDVFTINALLSGCMSTGDVDRAEKIWNAFILKYNIDADVALYTTMIRICGQQGFLVKAKQFYDEFMQKLSQPDIIMSTAMIQAYVKSNRIEEALLIKQELESAGLNLDFIGYLPLLGFYLKDTEHTNPNQVLQLLDECVAKNKLKKLPDTVLNIKHIAFLKLLEHCKTQEEKTKYFELILRLPHERVQNGYEELDLESARIVLDAHLIYYNHNHSHNKIIQFFEECCVSRHFGYWYYDPKMKQWLLDLHGYNYNEVEFVLYYILNHKCDDLVRHMGYKWIIICGKSQGTDPSSKQSQIGIKQFTMDTLKNRFQIRSKVQTHNPGRLMLNHHDTKEFKRRIQK
eukprot:20636_1